MATWGAYFTSLVTKTNEEPVKDSSLTGSGSTVEKNLLVVESTASKTLPTSKVAESKESSPRVEVKKLYDLNPTPDSKLEQTPPKFNSNAARVAKLFGYGSSTAPAASETSKPLARSVPPINSEHSFTPPKTTIPVTPVKPLVTVSPQPTTDLQESVAAAATPENVKKPSGLLAWAIGSAAKAKEPTVETKDIKSSLQSVSSENQQTTIPRKSIRMLSELHTSLQNVKVYNENILQSSETNLAPTELNSASTGLASKSNFSTISPSRFNINAPTQNNFDPSQSNTPFFNSSRPGSVASSASASTRYNQSSDLSSPISRRDSIFSRFSTSSSRPYDNSLASVEEKVAREIRLQAEKEHRMKLMAFTKTIEEMRIEREKMESDRRRMIDEEAAIERDEYQLKEKEEQMQKFISDVEEEHERAIKEREKLRLEEEEEERRQQEAIRLENEAKIRKQIEERERREEQERIMLEKEERERRKEQERIMFEKEERERRKEQERIMLEKEERERREEQEKIMLQKEKIAQENETRENKRNNSPILNYNQDAEPQLGKSETKEDVKKLGTNQEDEDDYSIYDDYYSEEGDLEEESLDPQNQLKPALPNDKAKQQRNEEGEDEEEELKRQRSLQASLQREEEEERQLYAEEQARRFRQQRPNETGFLPEAPGGIPPQTKLPQMELPQMRPQMGSPQMRPQMGSPQMRPQMGSPQMRPQMRPQMGSPQMRPQMGSPQMRPQMGSPQMRPQMRPPQMRPQMGSPQMRPQMGPSQMRPQMRPQMGSPQMRPQMRPPQMGPPKMRPQMRPPQMRPAETDQRIEQRIEQKGMLPRKQQQSEEETFQKQQEIEESEDEETDKEEEIRKAEIKMRKAFAELSAQKGTAPLPVQEFEVESRPPRNENPTYNRPVGGLPAGPRIIKGGLPARPR